MTELLCQSCPSEYASPATHIANAYGGRRDGSSWDWPVCEAHSQMAMCAGWFPLRKISEGAPFDPEAHLSTPDQMRLSINAENRDG